MVEMNTALVKTVIFLLFLQISCVFCRRRVYEIIDENNVSEGAPCETIEHKYGYCSNVTRCPGLFKDIAARFPTFCTCDKKVKKPLVCCPLCDYDQKFFIHFSNKTQNPKRLDCIPISVDLPIKRVPCKSLSLDFEDLDENLMCNKVPDTSMIRPVIAGGADAKRRQFPHMALLGYGPSPYDAAWVCGGSVIAPKYILTAAHCISSPALGKIKYAALGILKRSDDRRMWHIYDIVKIIGHPGYRPPSKYNDIALLETGKEISYNADVLPACLLKDPSQESRVGIAAGWGTKGHRKPLSEILQMVGVVRFSDDDCRKAYPVHRHLVRGYDPATQICYGSDEINDTCEGDSGGPLQKDAEPGRMCVAIVFGVTSYGKACGYPGSSGMYTKVTHYIPWIESIVGKLIY